MSSYMYILCKILSFLTRVAQKVFDRSGSYSLVELIILWTFNIQNWFICSSIRNRIAYANEANIVNKDSPILTYRFSVDWCPFFSFGAVIPYFDKEFEICKDCAHVRSASGWKLKRDLWRLTRVNTELHKTFWNRYMWYGYINRYVRILASEIIHFVMISQLVMNEMKWSCCMLCKLQRWSKRFWGVCKLRATSSILQPSIINR